MQNKLLPIISLTGINTVGIYTVGVTEVAGQLIKSVSDATDKLMDLQKKLKDVEEEKVAKGPSNVTNALFVGSTADLAKLIKKEDANTK